MSNYEIQLPDSVQADMKLPAPSLVSYWDDIATRTIWALKSIGDESYDWVSQIINWNRADADLPIEERTPIKIIIANYGGNLEEARMLSEFIQMSKTPVWTIAIGMCASAASVVYLSGHKKFATRNATFLFHRGGCDNLEGTYNELMSFMEKYQSDIEELTAFYVETTSFPKEEIERHLIEGDWYLDVTEGLAHGVVDELVDSLDVFL